MSCPTPPFQRLFALACTLLVLALGVVSVSPALHAQLHSPAVQSDCGHAHHPDTGEAKHELSCAVELFAAGISLPVDPTQMLVAPLDRATQSTHGAESQAIVAPDFRQPPGRGPPRV